jgi:hypothetical protein
MQGRNGVSATIQKKANLDPKFVCGCSTFRHTLDPYILPRSLFLCIVGLFGTPTAVVGPNMSTMPRGPEPWMTFSVHEILPLMSGPAN